MPKTRGLLPTPLRHGLLPHPVDKTLLGKRPFLQSSLSPQKLPLLDTPRRKSIPGFTKKKPRTEPARTPESMIQSPSEDNFLSNDDKINLLNSMKIYAQHKKKLINSVSNKPTVSLCGKNLQTRKIQLGSAKKDSNELTCLATYLLQMKTGSHLPLSQEQELFLDKSKQINNNTADETISQLSSSNLKMLTVICNSSQSSNIKVTPNSPTIENSNTFLGDKSSQSSNIKVTSYSPQIENSNTFLDNKSFQSSDIKVSSNSPQTENSNSLLGDKSFESSNSKVTSNSPPKENLNTLLTDGCLNNEISTEYITDHSKAKKHKIQLSQYAIGMERTVTSENDIVKVDKPKYTSDASSKNNCNLSSSFESKPFKKCGSVSKKWNDDKMVVSNIYSSNSSCSLPKNKDDLLPSNHHSFKLEQVIESKPKPCFTGASEKCKKPNTRIEDLPFIVPVSGFFCDVCCDFFFDETSTLEHCATEQHRREVEAVTKKSKSNDAKTLNRPQAAATAPPVLPDNAQQKAQARQKPRKWNFVIPKRK